MRTRLLTKIGPSLFTRGLKHFSSSPSSAPVLTEFVDDGRIALITLNNPSKLNALTEPLGDALTSEALELRDNPHVRAIILTGAGKAFSAGGDLNFLMDRHRDSPENNIAVMQKFYKRFLVLRSLPVPVIGAINGAAVGAGFCLALGGCDVRVAANNARMGLTFVKLGLHPGMAATHFLPLIAGPQVASDLLLTGRLVGAQEAQQMGLVAKVGEDAVDLALGVARDICKSAPVAVRTTLQTLRNKQNVGLEEAFLTEATAQSICYPTKDLAEGVKALQEKRSPTFTGE